MKPSPILSHMPWNVMKQIVVLSDTRSRLSLRKCSKKLRKVVDSTAGEIGSIVLFLQDRVITLWFSVNLILTEHPLTGESQWTTKRIEYHFHPEGHVMRDGDWEKLVQGHDHISAAVRDLATFIRSSKVHVHDLRFQVGYWNRDYNKEQRILDEAVFRTNIMKFFNSLDHKLHLGGISIRVPLHVDPLMQILSNVDPKTLTELGVTLHPEHGSMDRLTESEHWKHAHQLTLKADYYPIHEMSHFRYIDLRKFKLTVGDFKMIVENARKHGVNFKGLDIRQIEFEDHDAVADYLSRLRPRYHSDHSMFYRIVIPNSGSVLRFMLFEDAFHAKVLERDFVWS